MDGKTPKKKRKEVFAAFKSEPSLRVAVLGIMAAGTGLTLTSAHRTIMAEFMFDPSIHRQAEDRTHRIGQKKPCTIDYLYAKGTTDDRLWRIICTKADNSSLVLDGVRLNLNKTTKNVTTSQGIAHFKSERKKQSQTQTQTKRVRDNDYDDDDDDDDYDQVHGKDDDDNDFIDPEDVEADGPISLYFSVLAGIRAAMNARSRGRGSQGKKRQGNRDDAERSVADMLEPEDECKIDFL